MAAEGPAAGKRVRMPAFSSPLWRGVLRHVAILYQPRVIV